MHDLQERLEQIEGYATALAQGFRVSDERRCILEPLIRDDEIKNALSAKFDQTYGSHGYNHLVPLMAQDLVRDLVRLLMDENPKSASLVNLFRKANDKDVKCALRAKFREIPDKRHDQPGIPGLTEEESASVTERWRKKDREEFEASFDEGWDLVASAIDALKKDEVRLKLKTFRDKYHAHLEMTPLGEEPSRKKYIF